MTDKDSCPICAETISLDLKSLEQHSHEHSMTIESLWQHRHGGPTFCQCGCGKTTRWTSWKKGYQRFILGHNGKIYSSYDEETATKIIQKRRETIAGSRGWASGLSSETDDRIKTRASHATHGLREAHARGEINVWNKGLSKEIDCRVERMSKRLKKRFESGEIAPWAKGLSKETDERVRRMAINVSIAHKQNVLRERLDNLKRLSNDEINERIMSSRTFEIVGDLQHVKRNQSSIHVKCKECQYEFYTSLDNLMTTTECVRCRPNSLMAQTEIRDFITSLGFDTSLNDRSIISPSELDIWVPQKRLAIEFNGLYWHSEWNKSSQYHDNKTRLCKQQDVTLMHVFEDEWRDRNEIVKSIIKHRLGMTPERIAARKCRLIELSARDRIKFFDQNHIDGDVGAVCSYGLMLEDVIVAALSLRRPFHKKYTDMLEVARFSTLRNVSVMGGLSRLSSVSLEKAKQHGLRGLFTYVDTRLGRGKGYIAAGYRQIGETAPQFWWTDTHYRFNRFKFRADAETGLTEAQVAAEGGVVKIWGCSSLIMELT